MLESSPGLEVIEISAPALHETLADHDLELPGGDQPARRYNGQMFLRHVAADTPWTAFNGGEAQETRVSEATDGLAEVRTIRPGGASAISISPHEGELVFGFVLDGSACLEHRGSIEIGPGDAFAIPPGEAWRLSEMSRDFRLLHVVTARLDHRMVGADEAQLRSSLARPHRGMHPRFLEQSAARRASPCCCRATTRKRRSRATVAGFRAALPGATIYVYDNNSSDRTREVAAEAGAVVRTERQQGKGHVVRRMFADVDADVYVMADGDLTYDPEAAPAMVDMLLAEQLDMVVGTRRHEDEGRLSRRPRARQQALHRPALRACSGAASATSSRATASSRAAS